MDEAIYWHLSTSSRSHHGIPTNSLRIPEKYLRFVLCIS